MYIMCILHHVKPRRGFFPQKVKYEILFMTSELNRHTLLKRHLKKNPKQFCVSNRSVIMTMRQLEDDQIDRYIEERMEMRSRQMDTSRKMRGMEGEAQADMFPWAKGRDLG